MFNFRTICRSTNGYESDAANSLSFDTKAEAIDYGTRLLATWIGESDQPTIYVLDCRTAEETPIVLTHCLQNITVHMVTDADADLSWLDQSDAEMGEGFEEQSNQRKIDYHNGDWEMMGVYVTADVLSPNGVSHTLRSSGLWGIESDSGPEYFQEIAHEQIAEIVAELRDMGVSDEQIAEEQKYAYRQCAPVVYA